MGLALADQVADGRRRDEHLSRHHPTTFVLPLAQRLAHDSLNGAGQLLADLLLLVGREDVDHPVDGLGGILRVQRREHEVAGLRSGQRDLDGLEVAHLPDQNDVRVLPQDVFEGLGEGVGVGAHLTLVDQAVAVPVEELDGVLDGHDVVVSLCVRDVDQGGQRRALTGSGGTGHKYETTRQIRELRDNRRDAERFEALQLVRNHPEGRPHGLALFVHVDAEACSARQRVGEVEFELLLEDLPLLLGEHRVQDPLERGAVQLGRSGQRTEVARYADRGGRPDGEVQVTGLERQHGFERLHEADVAAADGLLGGGTGCGLLGRRRGCIADLSTVGWRRHGGGCPGGRPGWRSLGPCGGWSVVCRHPRSFPNRS